MGSPRLTRPLQASTRTDRQKFFWFYASLLLERERQNRSNLNRMLSPKVGYNAKNFYAAKRCWEEAIFAWLSTSFKL
jgi:hypothetical protein